MRSILVGCFLSLSSLGPLSAQAEEAYFEVSGTPPREEIESKFAAIVPEGFDDIKFTKDLHKALKVYSSQLSFGEVADCKLTIDDEPKSFAFLDEYFDTDAYDLLNNNAAYRLRFRWSKFSSYVRSKVYPFSSRFGPTRTEIQSKVGYERLSATKMSTTETRFEFRKESEPFTDGVDLPPASWEVEDYRKVALTGRYKNYRIYPYDTLLEAGIDQRNQLSKKLGLLTRRNRMHYNCKSAFGSGPNPEQLFIISIDRVYCEHGCAEKESLLEIEIERERNTSTLLDRVAGYEDTSFFSGPEVAKIAVDYARTVKGAFDRDHIKVSNRVLEFMKRNRLRPLPANYKYARFASKTIAKALKPSSK